MISSQVIKLANANQWRVNQNEDMVFGEYNGYLFTLFEGKRFKAFITPIAGISADALKDLTLYLQDHAESFHLYNFEISDNFLCVRIAEGLFPLRSEKLEMILGQLSGLLDLYGVPNSACIICGQPAGRRGLFMGLFCYLHPECEEKEMMDYTAASRTPETQEAQPGDLL